MKQISPISAATHYAAAAAFWENRAKTLLDEILAAEERIDKLEKEMYKDTQDAD